MTQPRYLHDALVTEAMTKSWCTEPNALKIFVLVDTDTWKIVEFEGKKLFFPNEMAAKQWYSIQHTGDVFEGDAWAEHNIEAQSVFDYILGPDTTFAYADMWWELWFEGAGSEPMAGIGRRQFTDFTAADEEYKRLSENQLVRTVRFVKVETVRLYEGE